MTRGLARGLEGGVTRATRADACPGAIRLHAAADGHLARIRLPGGRIDGRGLRAAAELADQGNGIVELTSRASLQVRGLPPEAGTSAAERLAAAGLLPSVTHERVRNILASPLSGRHPDSVTATDELVAALDRALCAAPELAALSGRFLFAVDDGAGLTGGHVADVALVATAPGAFALVVGGTPTGASASAQTAVELALDAARELMRSDPDRVSGERSVLGLPLGQLRQRDGRIALTALPPLGRLRPDTLRDLADLADDVRLSVARTLTLPDLEPDAAAGAERALRAHGMITESGSGWEGLSACAGLGACVRASQDVRAEAQRRAGERHPNDPLEHWAACERRCGHPQGPHLAFWTTEHGIEHEVVG